MNISQKQTILSEIETMQSFDFDNMILSQFPEHTDFNTIMFGNYNVLEFKSLFYKAITQLKTELESGLGSMLPNQENFHNDYGSLTLEVEIPNLKSYVSDVNNRDAAASLLNKLIYYQIRQGFWERSQIKQHDINVDKLNAGQQQLQLVQKSLAENLKTFDTLKSKFETTLSDVEAFFVTKKQEMAVVNRLLTEATNSNARITELVSSSTNKETEIDGILKNIKDKVAVVSESITEYETSFATIQSDAATLKAQLEITITNALTDLEKSKQGIEFIESNRIEIERLTGIAADGSLGSKFDQRQNTLADSLIF